MPTLETHDQRFGLRGPGQNGDNLTRRRRLVEEISGEVAACLEFRRTFYLPDRVRYAAHTVTSFRLRRHGPKPPKQIHELAWVTLHVLPSRNDIHRFGLTDDGTLFHERLLRIDRNHSTPLWFRVDDLFGTILSNGVLEEYLLWSLRNRT